MSCVRDLYGAYGGEQKKKGRGGEQSASTVSKRAYLELLVRVGTVRSLAPQGVNGSRSKYHLKKL